MIGISDNKNTKIIRTILEDPEKELQVRKVAKGIKTSPASVSITLSKLKKLGLIKRKKIDISNPKVRALKILFNIEIISNEITRIKKAVPAKGIGIYGSWANGTNTGQSDLDIWIKIEKQPTAMQIAELRSKLRKRINIEPSLLFLTKQKVEEIKKTNPPLYFSIVYSFHLWGKHID